MSIRLMTYVWKLSMPRNEKNVFLALCDHAHDDGSSVYPSVKSLSKKTGYCERQTQRILRRLEINGWIKIVGNSKGGAPGVTRQYAINLHKLTGGNMSPVKATRGDYQVRKGMTFVTPRGDTNVTQTFIEPSFKPYEDILKKARIPNYQIDNCFKSAQFLENGKIIRFKTKFIRDQVEQRFLSSLHLAFGFYPSLEVAKQDETL